MSGSTPVPDDDPDWIIRTFPGEEFGNLVAANEFFRAASRAGPGKPLIMLACEAGNPAYAHAEHAAAVVHGAGLNHNVCSTVGEINIRYNEDIGSADLGVQIPDGTAPSDAFTVIRAPNRPTGP